MTETVMNASADLAVAILCSVFFIVALIASIRKVFTEDNKIVRVHLGAGILHLLSALVIAWIVFAYSPVWEGRLVWALYAWVPIGNYEKFAGLNQTSNATDCSDGCIQTFYHQEAGNVPVALFAVLFGVASGGAHVISVLWDTDALITNIAKGSNTWRWIDYSISSSLMIAVVAVIVGVAEVFIVASVALSQFFLMIVAAYLERSLAAGERGAYQAFYISVVAYLLLVWMPIIAAFQAPGHESGASVPEWVYVVLYGLFLVYGCFGLVMWFYLVHAKPPISGKSMYFIRMDLKYVSLSLTSKLILHWTLFNGIMSRNNVLFHDISESRDKEGNPNILGAVIGSAAGSLLVGIAFYLYSVRLYSGSTGKLHETLL